MWRWLAMAAVAVSAVVFAIVFVGGDADTPRSGRLEADNGASQAGSSTDTTTTKPRLPPSPKRFRGSGDGGIAGQPPRMAESVKFEAEPRDASWADSMEDEIEHRIGKLLRAARGSDEAAVTARELECRSTSCRIIVGGVEPDAVRQFLESLQDERGFYGRADSLALERRGGERNEQPTEIGVFIKFLRR